MSETSSVQASEFSRAELINEYSARQLSKDGNFHLFCKEAWVVLEPATPLIWNWHLDAMCAYLEAHAAGKIKRLIMNVPPGSMKSLMVSVFLPSWIWTRDSSRRFINLTNEVGLAARDSRRMRDLIMSEWYQDRWGQKVVLSQDQKEKLNFELAPSRDGKGGKGFRLGLGITGNISGKRGNSLIIDDPIDTKKAFSDTEIQTVNDTYDQAVSSRLNDFNNDGIVLIMQRTRTNDLTGHLMSKKNQDWVLFKVPMEGEGVPGYDPEKDLGTIAYGDNPDIRDNRKVGALMFPERFSAATVRTLKEDLGDYGTAGQLQQRPSPLGGGIIKKSYWEWWPEDEPLPHCEHLFVSWDTAFSEKDNENAAYSACTVWGIFWHPKKNRWCMMVVKRWFGRVAYPDLRSIAMELTKELKPDCHLIEKKASGISLIQDLKRAGSGDRRVRLRAYMPDRDKVSRAYSATATMAQGLVYAPVRQWSKDLIDYCAEFPAGAPPSADLTDTVTQAILYLKMGWWIEHPDDEDVENRMVESRHQYDDDEADPVIYEGGMYG